MSAPNLEIKLEPVESGKAVYLPLAATTATGKTMVKIVLRLRIKNKNGRGTVKVNKIQFSFPGSSHAAVNMQGVNMDGSLDLAAGAAAYWSNGRVDLDPDPDVDNFINNAVYLNTPAPSQIKISVSCKDFTDPATVTMSLASHKSPTPEGAYRFPYAAGELRKDEYYQTDAVHWANGGAKGPQIFAHDIGVVGWDPKAKKWSSLLPGGASSKNEDYRIYNKPLRAVADGEVEEWFDGMDDNTVLGEFPDPTPSPGAGNNIWIRHGTELVKYAHLKKGSIPAELMKKGARVHEGQMIGRVGNTGNSTNPHTHIECVRDSTSGPLRPLPFRAGWVVDRSKLKPPGAKGPWFALRGHGISKEAVSIWPASTYPGFPVPAVGISMQGDWANSYWISPDLASFQQKAQALFDDHGRRLIRIATFVENGNRRWVGISRAGTWASRWWVSNNLSSFLAKAQELFDTQGLRLIQAASYLEGTQRKWFGIARGGDWASRLIVKPDLGSFSKEAQKLFDENGLRLIYVTTYVEGGKRKWFGISRSGDWANRWWISPDFGSFRTKSQDLFDNEGKRLVHVTTYVEGSQRRWVGISRSGDWANRWVFRSDLDAFNLEAQRLFDEEKLRLIHVEMLE
ncbi:MAG: M23 family metallopeptidase [Candidatus Manganitrophus sp. SB1]|nr:M23 family metallopeptidase [Candidatus Manganitrophus morganii]